MDKENGTYTSVATEGEKGESNQSGGRDGALMDAFAELRSLLARPEVPEGVYSACLRLSDFQTKLFCSVSDSYRTWDGAKWVEYAGTPHLGMRLEPSNFLRELLAALRAFEWPRVLILIHEATS